MKRLLLFIISLSLITPQVARASVDVNISGNGPGSKSEVSVENNVGSFTTTSQNSKGKTDIRIETNGEVKEFHGNGNDSVRLESGDSNNSVTITNNNSEKLEDEDSSESASTSADFDEGKNFEDDKETGQTFNLVDFIKEQLSSIFKLFGDK